MPDIAPIATPAPVVVAPTQDQVQAAISPLITDALQVEKEIAAIVAAYKAAGASGAAALLPALAPELTQSYTDVKAALPVLKAGYKTTEFWIVTGVTGGLAIAAAFGKVPAIDAASLITALSGVYAVVRGLLKKSTP